MLVPLQRLSVSLTEKPDVWRLNEVQKALIEQGATADICDLRRVIDQKISVSLSKSKHNLCAKLLVFSISFSAIYFFTDSSR